MTYKPPIIPIAPVVLDERMRQLTTARERFSTRLVPPSVYNIFPTRPSVRGCYAAISAFRDSGIKDPRFSEISILTGHSESSLTKATRALEAAGLITRQRAGGVGRPVIYRIVPLKDSQPAPNTET